MSTPPDGLGALAAKRERRHRSMPPPRHPVPASDNERIVRSSAAANTPTPGDEAQLATNKSPQNFDQQHENQPQTEEQSRPVDLRKDSRNVADSPANPPLIQITTMLEEPHVDWLDEIRILGLTSKPKIDITRSAILRLAVTRLREQMQVNEIAQWFLSQPEQTTTGRKRR